jgi:hypothetical protein
MSNFEKMMPNPQEEEKLPTTNPIENEVDEKPIDLIEDDQDKVDTELLEKFDHRGVYDSDGSENDENNKRYRKIYEEIGEKGGIKMMEELGSRFINSFDDMKMKNTDLEEKGEGTKNAREAFNKIGEKFTDGTEENSEKVLRALDVIGNLAVAGSRENRKKLYNAMDGDYSYLSDEGENKTIQEDIISKTEEYIKESLLELTKTSAFHDKSRISEIYEEMKYFSDDPRIIKRLVDLAKFGFKEDKIDDRKDCKVAAESLHEILEKRDDLSVEDIKIYGELAKAGDSESKKTLEVIRDEDDNEEFQELAGEILKEI